MVTARPASGAQFDGHRFAPGTETRNLRPDRPPRTLDHPGWYDGYLFSQALTIGGGTGEVQRNIVAERVLGLPHDVDVQHGLSWSEAQRAAPDDVRCSMTVARRRPGERRVTIVVAAAEAVAPLVAGGRRGRAGPAAAGETVDALVAADLMRMGLAAAYGGPEADPLTMLTAIEVLARADGAAGWCSMIASTTSTQALFLDPTAARRSTATRHGDGRRVRPTGTGVVDGDR